jgi:hypothetical protein
MKRERCLPDFNQIWISRQIIYEGPSIKFEGNPFSGSRADTCGQTDTELMKTISAFRDCAEKQ